MSTWLKKLTRSVAVLGFALLSLGTAMHLPVVGEPGAIHSAAASVANVFKAPVAHAAPLDVPPNDATNDPNKGKESDDPTADTWYQTLIKEVMYGAISFFGYVTLSLFNIMSWVAQYNGFTTEPIVVKGWTLVRDVCNMFFIFAMLLIAFGTILRIQAYHYRSMLFKVVLAAVLMNLSKSIAGILIDLSQVVMLTFVSAFQHLAAGSLSQALGIDKLLNLAPTDTTGSGLLASNAQSNFDAALTGGETKGAIASTSTLVASYILAAVLMFLIFVTILAIVATLLVRILKLWILVILSPLAFAGTLIKGVGSAAGRWWDELTKELVAGPTLMFFLWLVLAIAAPAGGQIISGSDDTFNPTNLSAGSTKNLVNLLVVVGLLWAGIGVAKAGGGAAAAAVGFGIGKIGKGSVRLAGRGAASTGRWAGKWARQGLSASGLQARGEMIKEGVLDSRLGKAVTFFSKKKTEQRWAERQRLRRERVVQHMEVAENTAALAGKDVGWIQSAKRRREQKWRAESNVAANKYMKEFDENGITDDASIRAEIAANMKDGKVLNHDKQTALLRQLASKGKVLDANRDILENTVGMSDQARASLKGVFKDHDTSAIRSDGTTASGDDLQSEIDSVLKGDTDRGAKGKRLKGINAKVRVDESGQPVNSTATAILRSEALNEDYIEKVDKSLHKDLKEALLLAAHNANESGDTALRDDMVKKYNQLFAQTGPGAKPGFDGPALDASGVATEATMLGIQEKAAAKQERDQIKAVRLKRDSNAPLDEAEKSWQQLVESIKGAPEKINELRAKLAELAAIDLSTVNGRHDAADLTEEIGKIQRNIEAEVRSSTMELHDKNGQPIAPKDFMRQMMGGNLEKKLESRAGDEKDFSRYAADLQQGLAARFNRVSKAAPPKSKIPLYGSTPRSQATKYGVPVSGKYVEPRFAVNRQASEAAGKTQAQATAAFKQVEQVKRTENLEPVLRDASNAIDKMLAVGNIDPLLKQELESMKVEAANLQGNIANASEKDVQDLLGRFSKLKNLT